MNEGNNSFKNKNYSGIDICKYIFACLIPFLHIRLPLREIVYIQQYISRSGVPFFFSVSGFLLSQSLQMDKHYMTVLKRYIKRISRLLLIWFIIYLPIFIATGTDITLKSILFLTPGYLWYLMATLVAAIPFVLVKKRAILYVVSIFLYILGTLLSESYTWLSGGGWKIFEDLFITPRNGFMFCLPLMCAGELAAKIKIKPCLYLYVSLFLLWSEITLVGLNISKEADRSFYFMLPIFTFFLLQRILLWNPHIKTDWIRRSSSAIYLMQYGIIKICLKLIDVLNLSHIFNWIVLVLVIVIPTSICHIFKSKKFIRYIF